MFVQTDKKPFTADQWKSLYSYLGLDPTMLLGYMESSRLSACELRRLVEKSTTFEELKEQLLGFAQEQENLINTIDEIWYGDNPEKFDLPRFDYSLG